MLNKINIMGRLTRDPETRTLTAGTQVTNFTVACERDFVNRSLEKKETDFINCVAFRTTAEFAQRNLTKGKLVVVDGKLQSRNWQDKEGNKRTTYEIVVDNIYFAESKKEQTMTELKEILADDDLPF